MNDNLASQLDPPVAELETKLSALAERVKGTDMELSPESQSQILAYLGILSNYNQKVNLVGNCDPHHLIDRHTLDGLTLVSRIRKHVTAAKSSSSRLRYLDIGTGGGLPGMIVALACPELAVTLLDATAKKCNFLEMIVAELNHSERIEVINGRAEELARDDKFRERYRFVTARAVGTLKVTIELAIPFLKPGGLFLAQKTSSRIEAESAESKDLLTNIGAEIGKIESLEQFEELKEALIVPVKKLHVTPNKYPREWKQIVPSK